MTFKKKDYCIEYILAGFYMIGMCNDGDETFSGQATVVVCIMLILCIFWIDGMIIRGVSSERAYLMLCT